MSECVYEVYPFDTDIIIRGYFTESIDDNVIQYISPSPPDYRSSFSGSALPYANEEQAFENTPNLGRVFLKKNNAFSFNLSSPNRYYADFTNKVEAPYVIINYKMGGIDKNLRINLDELSIPYRSLSHPEHRNELFYSNEELPIRTQEQILRDSKYPVTSMKDKELFWGLKPAC